MGYISGTKGYVVLDMLSRSLNVSMNLFFYDHILPYRKLGALPWDVITSKSFGLHNISVSSVADDLPHSQDISQVESKSHSAADLVPLPAQSRSSTRTRHQPSHLKNYICHSSSCVVTQHLQVVSIIFLAICLFLIFLLYIINMSCHYPLSLSQNLMLRPHIIMLDRCYEFRDFSLRSKWDMEFSFFTS